MTWRVKMLVSMNCMVDYEYTPLAYMRQDKPTCDLSLGQVAGVLNYIHKLIMNTAPDAA